MKKGIPDSTVAVILNTGSVFHPIWPNAEREGYWVGTKIKGEGLALKGNYTFPPSQVERCLTQGQFEIWEMCERHGAELPPAK